MARTGAIASLPAGAEMARGTLDVAAELVRLKELTIFDLRQEWRRLERLPPPMRLSRDLLVRGIVYKLQERAFGGLSKSMLRRLTKGAHRSRAGESRGSAAAIVTKPGTRLVREWCGVTHSVLVLADGVEWRGQRYRSLSVVAREITGAHWSGPRFFGLARRTAAIASAPTREGDHAQA